MKEMIAKLERICRQMGVLSGIGMMDETVDCKNHLLYQQEIRSLMQDKGVHLMPEEVYGSCKNEALEDKLKLYNKVEESGDVVEEMLEAASDEASGDILASMNLDDGNFLKLLSCYEAGEELQPDAMISWSVRLNYFFRKRGLLSEYYVPFAKYLWKLLTAGPRETLQWEGEREWLNFYLSLLETSLDGTVKIMCAAITRQCMSKEIIADEKQKVLLNEMLSFMEETPVFDIREMAQEFQVAYNTAAKMVHILEQHDLVSEISRKQRYRIYCYEKYLQEYGGLD